MSTLSEITILYIATSSIFPLHDFYPSTFSLALHKTWHQLYFSRVSRFFLQIIDKWYIHLELELFDSHTGYRIYWQNNDLGLQHALIRQMYLNCSMLIYYITNGQCSGMIPLWILFKCKISSLYSVGCTCHIPLSCLFDKKTCYLYTPRLADELLLIFDVGKRDVKLSSSYVQHMLYPKFVFQKWW